MSTTEAPSSQHHNGGAMSVVSTNQPRPAQHQLRRAVYIHVSDLTSAYNIDHARLEEELERVKAERENPPETKRAFGGVPSELDTSYPQKRLQPPRRGNNMVVLVGKVRVVVDKKRVDGSRVRLAEVEVGDETGTVSLRARDDQIDIFQEVSERSGAVVLRNCTLELYQGKHMRLAITKWGKLSKYPDQVPSTPAPPSKMNHDRNFSMIDLSLVASELVAAPQQQSMETQLPQPSTYAPFPADIGGVHESPLRQTFQPQGTSGGRGQRGRRPSRGKGIHTPPQVHYSSEQSGSMSSPMRTQPYAQASLPGVYAPAVPSYQPGQHQQQQQMMMHHQFEMQQRQMQQMAYQQQGGDRQQSQRSLQPPSSPQPQMLSPGLSSTASYDTAFTSGSGDVGGPPGPYTPPPGSGSFMLPTPPSPGFGMPQADQQQQAGSMNPQAATFDPAANLHRKPSS